MIGCYLTSLPKQAMRALAGFYAQKAGAYRLIRASVDPPEELLNKVFPDIEYWQDKFDKEEVQKDLAGPNFLEFLKYLRVVLLQDSVVLKQLHPNHFIWKDALFDLPLYKQYELQLSAHIASTNEDDDPINIEIERILPHLTEVLRSSLGSMASDIVNVTTCAQELNTSQQQGFVEVMDGLNNIFSSPFYLSRNPASFEPTYITHGTSNTMNFITQDQNSSNDVHNGDNVTTFSMDQLSLSTLPQYKLNRHFITITDIWREYADGIGGNPSIEHLENNYKTKWRKNPTESRFYIRRKIIYDEVKRIATEKRVSRADAAQELEKTRKELGISIDKLGKELEKKRKKQD